MYEANRGSARRGNGEKIFNEPVSVFKGITDKNGDLFVKEIRYAPRELVKWQKGDVVVENPVRLEAGNKNINLIRRAMADAYGRELYGNEVDMLAFSEIVREYRGKINNIRNDFIDPNAPQTSTRWNAVSEFEFNYIMEALSNASHLGLNKEAAMKQVLMMFMTPTLKDNGKTWGLVGYDARTQQAEVLPQYNSNKRYERIVMNFLTKAAQGDASTVMTQQQATDILKDMTFMFKRSFVKQWDPTMQGDIFDFRQSTRSVTDYSLTSPINNIPKFLINKSLN